jgi:hypothetical protein
MGVKIVVSSNLLHSNTNSEHPPCHPEQISLVDSEPCKVQLTFTISALHRFPNLVSHSLILQGMDAAEGCETAPHLNSPFFATIGPARRLEGGRDLRERLGHSRVRRD